MNKFTRFVFLAVICAQSMMTLNAQNNSNYIPITVVAARQQNVPESVNAFIENKMQQVISQNGLGSADYYGRFLLTASIVPVTKDIVAGPPKQFAENIDVTFYIVDNIDKKIFSSTTVSAKAVDSSEEKVLNKAIRSINVHSPRIVEFVDRGRKGIVEYYSSQVDQIIAKAKSLAKGRNYEASFYELYAVPEACGNAYQRAVAVANAIYQEYVDYEGELNLAKARSCWYAKQNASGAAEAGEYLSKILPDAKCYSKAENLYQEIKKKVQDDWKFEMQVYKDDVSIERSKIEAWKAIGVAYGKGQQPVDTNITWLVK